MTTIYLASPLGFSHEFREYRERIRERLHELGCTVLDPWEPSYRSALENAARQETWAARVAAFKAIAATIGKANDDMIRTCDILLGVLDGAELDSGTVSEIGFAAGLGKRCYGLRTDFRDCGELDGLPFNLQVLYWIESSGGCLFRKIEDIVFP
jgi:nucleoside 2-deoxyribosyltransferase